ncbi:MAG TPA: histidine kinase [Candidatus Mediterraneibacter caccavium]|uniref:Histidine kinase n=1 Tax=Candidatus Mediterraneibacter caccavium TaxID=2838661 RepID=A0A9D1VW20_9FIRM|nr:histidine kinase [Candidatus Mediterraneibacter caccavium]
MTIISIFAEDNDDEQVASMCIKLTQMLQYITEDISKDTTFSLELNHTRNYTDLISIRFGQGISFDYQVDPSMNRLRLPRLVIQPIVENCVKYSRKPDRVLRISIHAWMENGFWYVNIQDNGDGFSKEALKEIDDKIRNFDLGSKTPFLSIQGMGLVNIYLRLKLYYSDHFYFKLENKPGQIPDAGGVSITIGGNTHERT